MDKNKEKEKQNKKFMRNSRLFIPMIVCILFLVMIITFKFKKIFIVFLLCTLASLYLVLAKILVSKFSITHPWTLKGAYWYDLITDSKLNFLKRKQPEKKPAVKWTQLILVILFIYLPLIFIALLLQGTWSYSQLLVGSGRLSEEGTGINEYTQEGDVQINSTLDLNKVQGISYLIGREINLPLFNICFMNNGTNPDKIINESFNSSLRFNLYSEFEIKYKDKVCVPYIRSENASHYKWLTSYECPVGSESLQNSNYPAYYAQPNNIILIQGNYPNITIISLIIILSWWAILVLICNAIKLMYNGLELIKN
jgi:hypothetical protein